MGLFNRKNNKTVQGQEEGRTLSPEAKAQVAEFQAIREARHRQAAEKFAANMEAMNKAAEDLIKNSEKEEEKLNQYNAAQQAALDKRKADAEQRKQELDKKIAEMQEKAKRAQAETAAILEARGYGKGNSVADEYVQEAKKEQSKKIEKTMGQ